MSKKPFPRFINPLIEEALKDSPAVLIHGPRQCGKTTLARMFGEAKKYEYISFDEDVLAKATKEDPSGFVKGLPKKIILDEVQKAPNIFSALKKEIDNSRKEGRFILTGSANILRMSKLSDSLAGRIEVLRLHPLSQEELQQKKSCFLDTLFKSQFKTKKVNFSLDKMINRIVTGGYPAVFKRPTIRRKMKWYRNYIETLLQKDALDLSNIRSTDTLPKLLSLSASQNSQLVNFTHIASAFQLSRPTIFEYMNLLEQMFFLERLSPWHSNRSKRLIKTPKLHLCDTGLICTLLGINSLSLKKNRPLLGQILETFVFQELRRQASYHKVHHNFFHYRNKKGDEVDIVIEKEHLTAGIEVKSSATVNIGDFKGLKVLKKAIGKNFTCGIILYGGENSVSFGKGLFAVPLSFLWS